MLGDALRDLKLDRRLASRRGWVTAESKNEATTETLVRDGETIVIGGIYVIDKSVTSMSIPYFNQIPGLQWLFRNHISKDNKKELIIFVTPRIVGQESAA